MSIFKPGNPSGERASGPDAAGKLSQWRRYVAKAWRTSSGSPGVSSHAFSEASSSGPAMASRQAASSESDRPAPQPDGWEIWETARFVIVRLQVPGLHASAPEDLKLRVKSNTVLFIGGRAQAPGRPHADAFEKHIELPASVSRDIAEVTVAADQALVTVILAKEGEPLPPHG